jgi:predicted DNA-binding transcriptional regulator YafY
MSKRAVLDPSRVERLIWLTAKICIYNEVAYPTYREQFNVTRMTYYRDLNLLKEFGMVIRSRRGGATQVFVSFNFWKYA